MPITPEHAGRSYPASAPYRVSAAKIQEFAAALGGVDGGDTNPAYLGDHPLAPPTFSVVLASRTWDQLFDDAELGLALSRTVHADQQFRFRRPLHDGDEVTATLTIDSVRSRGPMDWVGVSVTIETTAGEHVCTATSTLVHTRSATEEA